MGEWGEWGEWGEVEEVGEVEAEAGEKKEKRDGVGVGRKGEGYLFRQESAIQSICLRKMEEGD